MNVTITTFPQTKVAVIHHRGPPWLEDQTARKLVTWKLEHRLLDQTRYRSYGLHYTDHRVVAPDDHRVDMCLSYDERVAPNPYGVEEMVIPSMRCAVARDIGSRSDNKAARFLYDIWLPNSGEKFANLPVLFHYVNVGPKVMPQEAITDVYLPIE